MTQRRLLLLGLSQGEISSTPYHRSCVHPLASCSRGIGLEFVTQLGDRLTRDDILIATCRSPDSAGDLKAVVDASKAETHILQLDITNEESINHAVHDVEAILGERGIDYLLSNAAIVSHSPQYSHSCIGVLNHWFPDKR